jgi:hypothetical protein
VVDSLLDLQQQHSWRLTQLQSFSQQHSSTQQQQQQQQQGLQSFTQLPLSQALQSFDSQLGFDLPQFELRQQRRNEALYLVQVQQDPHQQQQQQQQDEEGRAAGAEQAVAMAAAAAAMGGLSVQQWPWESVGLAKRQAGSSSGDSSDGKSHGIAAAAAAAAAVRRVFGCFQNHPCLEAHQVQKQHSRQCQLSVI